MPAEVVLEVGHTELHNVLGIEKVTVGRADTAFGVTIEPDVGPSDGLDGVPAAVLTGGGKLIGDAVRVPVLSSVRRGALQPSPIQSGRHPDDDSSDDHGGDAGNDPGLSWGVRRGDQNGWCVGPV